eukprot:4110339-Pleurochrysis_carterae.AAC.1
MRTLPGSVHADAHDARLRDHKADMLFVSMHMVRCLLCWRRHEQGRAIFTAACMRASLAHQAPHRARSRATVPFGHVHVPASAA